MDLESLELGPSLDPEVSVYLDLLSNCKDIEARKRLHGLIQNHYNGFLGKSYKDNIIIYTPTVSFIERVFLDLYASLDGTTRQEPTGVEYLVVDNQSNEIVQTFNTWQEGFDAYNDYKCLWRMGQFPTT